MDINSLIQSAKNAIFYMEEKDARKLLQEIDNFINSQDLDKTDPEQYKNLQKIITYLKIVSFSTLPDEESIDILRNHYLESFEIDASMENLLIAKLFLEPFGPRDILRKKLKQAVLENNQSIGSLTISQWIKEFEKDYNVHTRKPSSSIEFVTTNTNARKLGPVEQNMLKKILHTYDYLLVSTIPTTEPELSEFLKSANPEYALFDNAGSSNQTLNNFEETSNLQTNPNQPLNESAIKNITISDAIKNYPELGEQLITSMRIKLKSFPEPVRPSINNWLSDYTFNLGFESHKAMDRGTYLFRNANAKILNSADRERLSYILKAYDENSLVNVNTNTKQIIFPRHEQGIKTNTPSKNISQELGANYNNIVRQSENNYRPQQQFSQVSPIKEIYNAKKQTSKPKDIFEKEREASENRNTGNINFSSPQKLPYEKQNTQSPQSQNISPVHTPLQNQSPRPMRISSQNLRDSSEETQRTRINPHVPPGNIVNLKDKQ